MSRFTFGDIVENAAASDDNPLKRGVFVKTFNGVGEFRSNDGSFWRHDVNSRFLSKVGTVFESVEEVEKLRAENAELRNELYRRGAEVAGGWLTERERAW